MDDSKGRCANSIDIHTLHSDLPMQHTCNVYNAYIQQCMQSLSHGTHEVHSTQNDLMCIYSSMLFLQAKSPLFLSSVGLQLEPRLLSTFNGRYLSVPVLTSRASLWLTRRLTVEGFQKVLLFSCLLVTTTRTTSSTDYRVDRPTTPLLFSPSEMVKFEVNQLQFTFEINTLCASCYYHDVVTPYRILCLRVSKY